MEPSHLSKKASFTKKYADALKKLSKDATKFTLACDYDIEGEVIGWNVLRYICNRKEARRMKFSTLTKEDIQKAYDEMMPSLDWGLAYSGETRHYLDYFYGISLSRALMSAMKRVNAFKILSIGRVQGPALNLVVEREKSILSFKSRPFFQVFLNVKNKHEVTVKYHKDIFDKSEADEFLKLKDKEGKAKTEKKETILEPLT